MSSSIKSDDLISLKKCSSSNAIEVLKVLKVTNSNGAISCREYIRDELNIPYDEVHKLLDEALLALDVVDDLKRIVSQNKSEQECYKDILTYIYKEKDGVSK